MQYICCSKTGDEGNIYAARQEMRACNNNNMRNPKLKDVGWGYACYCCMPSSPELSCYMALATGVSSVVDKIEWWQNHKQQLPN